MPDRKIPLHIKLKYFIGGLCLIIVFLLLWLFLNRDPIVVNNYMENPPGISIMSQNKSIVYRMGLNQWNGGKYDRDHTLHALMKSMDSDDLKHIKNGEEIAITFVTNPPDSMVLFEVVINEEGREVYTHREMREIPIIVVDNIYKFTVTPNMAAMLSSNSETYEPGGLLRGYRLICSWGDNECEYGFAIGSDA